MVRRCFHFEAPGLKEAKNRYYLYKSIAGFCFEVIWFLVKDDLLVKWIHGKDIWDDYFLETK